MTDVVIDLISQLSSITFGSWIEHYIRKVYKNKRRK